MSLHKTTINNFMHLLITQPLLFSEKDKLELHQLIDIQSDDIKSLSNAISNWCSNHHQIDDILADLEEQHPKSKAPGLDKANSNIPEYQTDKRTLLNNIQQSSPSPKNSEKKTGNT
ncbi:hypothetical protein [Nostoc sp.]|uniref:hypothetical protein n=1 Tax=Nostoc sp. TaxID=1180 RepID=UPI002FF05A95